MADNVQITAGSGTTIATDDVAGVQFQKVKLDLGGDGVSVPAPGDATNGVDVDVTRIPTSSSSAVTSVDASATSVQLLASTSGRKGLIIQNDKAGTAGATLYVKFGTTASSTDFTFKLAPDEIYESGVVAYTGRIDAIWASANGAAKITELS